MGNSIEQHPEYFKIDGAFRPGNMVDYLLTQADPTTKVRNFYLLVNDSPYISNRWYRCEYPS